MKAWGKIMLCGIMALLCNVMWGQSVGLVLSGGGAKGLSHIGVIKALETNNIPIDYICGTSMGAIVGSLYAAGFTPDQMLALVKSREFESWYKGVPERKYASYFYRDESSPAMFALSVTRKEGKLKVDIPTSIVSPYSMDLALLEVFAPASVLAHDNFDSLMIPFFCVAADIKNKRPLVSRNGNLGSAVRASMTYPFVFKPITIDSLLLFDGGFYNNFPWDIMEKVYGPDFIIGSKCVVGDNPIDEDDIVTHVSNMLMSPTDYQIPQEKGLVIAGEYHYGLMDFDKADKIALDGYMNALPHMRELKERIKRQRSSAEVDSMRKAFRKRQERLLRGGLEFRPDIVLDGNVSSGGKEFIRKTINYSGDSTLRYRDLKRNYYRLVDAGRFKTLYPSYSIEGDSLVFRLRVTRAPALSISVGGNVSTGPLNQGFLGLTYSYLSANPWKAGVGMNLGKHYKGGYVSWRQDISMRPMMSWSVDFVVHQRNYQGIEDGPFGTGGVEQFEYYGKAELSALVSDEKNVMVKLGVVAGHVDYSFGAGKSFTLVSPVLKIGRNTLDYPIYPTKGRLEYISLRGNLGHNKFLFRAMSEAYYKISRGFVLGYNVDLVLSNRVDMGSYGATMLYMPAFRPSPHSSTVLMEGYRGNSWLGVGISPVILFSNSLFLHSNISWFQPYEYIVKSDGGGYGYSEEFPKGAMTANAALVWRSPIGDVSMSLTYYGKGEKRWYPQLNIGFLIFKKSVLDL